MRQGGHRGRRRAAHERAAPGERWNGRAVHPLLFAAFPVLFLFRQNVWGLTYSDVAVPLAVTLAAVVLLQVAVGRATRRPRKVATILSAVVLLFFSYGHVWRVAAGEHGRLLGTDADLVLGPLWLAFAALVIVVVTRARRSLSDVTRVLNIVALTLVAMVVVPLSAELVENRATAATDDDRPGALMLDTGAEVRRPDIYYLVFDRYAGARTLEELFGYDNRPFLDHLQDEGFQVADRARANYQSTAPSLATSLNMKYLDWIAESQTGKRASSRPLYDAIKRSTVARALQQRGYRYVHVGSRWDMTRSSPIADVNIESDTTTEFTRVFFGSTALLPMMRHGVFGPGETDRPETARRITMRQIDEVAAGRAVRGPKFVFAHFGLPHPPYVFDRDGRPRDRQPVDVAPKARAYIQQLEYTNELITGLVAKLVDAPPDEQPVIILQADEGPYPSFGWQGPSEWWRTTDEKLRTKFRILMAVRMPGVEAGAYPRLSPVNVFRVVFNSYFGTELPLLPDRSFVPTSHDRMYEWTEITGRLHDPPGEIRDPAYGRSVDVMPQIRRSS